MLMTYQDVKLNRGPLDGLVLPAGAPFRWETLAIISHVNDDGSVLDYELDNLAGVGTLLGRTYDAMFDAMLLAHFRDGQHFTTLGFQSQPAYNRAVELALRMTVANHPADVEPTRPPIGVNGVHKKSDR